MLLIGSQGLKLSSGYFAQIYGEKRDTSEGRHQTCPLGHKYWKNSFSEGQLQGHLSCIEHILFYHLSYEVPHAHAFNYYRIIRDMSLPL